MEPVLDLEKELLQELEKFDKIFSTPHEPSASESQPQPSHAARGTLSAYELAAAESEKEELQDKLRVLLNKTEDFDWQLRQLSAENVALRSANEQLFQENQHLKLTLAENDQHLRHNADSSRSTAPDLEDFRLLEFKLAETRSKLARMQQQYEDIYLAKEQALRELELERVSRLHAEKEKDAYSAAYEASLQHFEKWSNTKLKKSSRFGT